MKKTLIFSIAVILVLSTLTGCGEIEKKAEQPNRNQEFIEAHTDIPVPVGLTIEELNWGNTIDQFIFSYNNSKEKFIEEIEKSIKSGGWTFIVKNHDRLYFTKENSQIIVVISQSDTLHGLLTVEPLGTEEIPGPEKEE